MAHISRFLHACLSIFSIAWAVTTSAVDTYVLSPIVTWLDFKPDAGVSLALDRAAHDVSLLQQPTIASQFKAFMSRALLHKHFDGEHFDPGRVPA